MTAHSCLAQEKTSSVVWNSSSTTLVDLAWKCISAKVHHCPKLNAFLPPPLPVLSTCTICHDAATTMIQRALHCPHHRATCTKLDLPDGLPYWLLRCCCVIPPKTCKQRKNSMQIDQEICLIHSRQESHWHHPHTPQVTCSLPPQCKTKNQLC
jgi:hypothetical protein